MFDSHCHLHDARIGADAAAMIARARAAGVTGLLLAGVEPDGWREEDRLAAAHPEVDVLVSWGVHPQLVAEVDDDAAATMTRALAERLATGRPAAIGEIGLDGVGERRASLPRQERAFREQLAMARAADLPVALHVLRTHQDALPILRRDGLPRAGGVVHSYSGGHDLVTEYVRLGLHLSFAGSVSWQGARRTVAAAAATPRERLLVETDAPDQTPEPHRPGRNEPAYLVDVIAALAAARGEDPADVAALTDANARRLFRRV